eukprot:scaffold154873_cov30-Prasinocladus_malaysianus.AAC.1
MEDNDADDNHALAAEVLSSLSTEMPASQEALLEPKALVEALSLDQPLRAQQALLHTFRHKVSPRRGLPEADWRLSPGIVVNLKNPCCFASCT